MTKASTAKKMQALVSHYHASGQTQEAFAKVHGVSKSKLNYWIRKEAKKPGQGVPRDNFVPLPVPSPPGAPATGSIYIRFKGGVEIEIPIACLP